MALMHTPAPVVGSKAPDFLLKSTDGKSYSFKDVAGKNGTLVMFICNHCPYVKAIAPRLTRLGHELAKLNVGIVAIMPNDAARYTDDSFDNMKIFAAKNGFTFPYVIDETQETARTYGAVCTPDFFGYNARGELQYRGRLDEVNPSRSATPATRDELIEAMQTIAMTGLGPAEQTPSMGCSIKWKEDRAA